MGTVERAPGIRSYFVQVRGTRLMATAPPHDRLRHLELSTGEEERDGQ